MRSYGGRGWRATVLVCGCTGLALVTGCGGDDEAGETSTATVEVATTATTTASTTTEAEDGSTALLALDPCSLLAESDVKAILGTAVEGELAVEPDPETGTPGRCAWEAGGADLSDPDAVFSIVVSTGDEAWYESNADLVAGDESFEELDGIADAAFAADTRAGLLSGGASLTVELGTASGPSSHETTLDALERLEANFPT